MIELPNTDKYAQLIFRYYNFHILQKQIECRYLPAGRLVLSVLDN